MLYNAEGDTYVALLRGINVGGKNLLPMEQLRRTFEALGCQKVRTYIQSGNVIFTANTAIGRRVPESVNQAIRSETGLDVPVIVRSAEELAQAVRSNPFRSGDAAPRTLHIAFLAKAPSIAEVAALDPNRSPPDQFKVVGREVYLWLLNGVARTRITNAYLDSKLRTVSTVRGCATLDKLVELCQE